MVVETTVGARLPVGTAAPQPLLHPEKTASGGGLFQTLLFLWKSVLGTKEVFTCGAHFELGDGRTIGLWRDKWGGMSPLSYLFPDIFRAVSHKNCTISDSFGRGDWL